MAERQTKFDRDTAVEVIERRRQAGQPTGAELSAEVSPDWQVVRGPHGGYLAAIILRALTETVDDPARAPRSLTIHYARAPQTGPLRISTTIERAGRSLSTLSARIEQDGTLVALALAAFSVSWSAPEIADLRMPEVAPCDQRRESGALLFEGAPQFTQHLVLQPRIGVSPFEGSSEPMRLGAWIGLAEPRSIDALSLAFFSDAMLPPPFIRMSDRAVSPTIDLTIHFRTALGPRDSQELCFAYVHSELVHEGFFEVDGVIWDAEGSVLAQSRQLALLLTPSES